MIQAGPAELRQEMGTGQVELHEELRAIQAGLRTRQAERREERSALGTRLAVVEHRADRLESRPGGDGVAGVRALRGGRLSRILIAGCGDVGTALGLALAEHGHEVFGARRSAHRLPEPLHPLPVDLTDARAIERADPHGRRRGLRRRGRQPRRRGVPARLRRRGLGPAGGAGGAGRAAPAGLLRVEHLRLRRARRRVDRRDGAARAARLRGREPRGGRAADARESDPRHRGALRRHLRPRPRLDDRAGAGRRALRRRPAEVHEPHPPRRLRRGARAPRRSRRPVRRRVHRGRRRPGRGVRGPGMARGPARHAPAPRWVRGDEAASRGSGKRCSNARLRASGYRFRHPTFREGYAAVLAGEGVRYS